ncbi:SLC13 family permease [Mesorhizobium sp. RP14(2022)]|uniref:SLC13 family permease n=1 Tax=Mesorhizobium liriopis TaxID=2953882 RepID=A0ABT1CDY8_9HYPH|nr:SLC13 family permease [Mesorhizobium liriopis]MCO6052176.1 SLC13 family permease [Mesorhizobium liriopis]
MTNEQILSASVIVLMMAAFLWGRFRYDLVAVGALLASIAVGIVPFDRAFNGFSDDIVIIVGSALLVSAGVARSGVMEYAIQRFLPGVKTVSAQLLILVGVVTLLSAVIKNIGALAIMMPIAFQFARRSNVSPSRFLMPMAFGALLGGLMTQVGTSPNVVVSRMRGEITGEPFTMFDFTPVGAALALVGILFLVLFHRLLPERQRVSADVHEAIDIKNYVTEAIIVEGSSLIGMTVGDLRASGDEDVQIVSIARDKTTSLTPLPDTVLQKGDRLTIEGEAEALDRLVAHSSLSVTGERRGANTDEDFHSVEAVVSESSPLIGRSAEALTLFDRYNVNLIALSRRNGRVTESLGQAMLRSGDVVVIQGSPESLPVALRELDLFPLAERKIRLGSVRRGFVPVLILVLAIGATAFGVVPVPVAFFAAAAAMVAFRVIPLREVYGSLDGPILVMLAALIPVSDSLRTTGATDLIAAKLAEVGTVLPPYGALALILVAAMAVTPFLNNAATVLVMAPIAAGFAHDLGFRPDAFLMAVAIGAGCDFLTPIGHQCNTLVMGPGGYRFGDYARLGAPLSLIVILVAVPLLLIVWPLQ